MTGKVHAFIGVGSLAAFCVAFPKGFEFANTTILPGIGLISAAFGSYLPDIDLQRSHIGHKFSLLSKLVSKYGGGHRCVLTHSLLIPAIITVFMWLLCNFLPGLLYGIDCEKLPGTIGTVVSFLINNLTGTVLLVINSLLFGTQFGYCMHIFADLFNGKGAPVLWPISTSKIHIMDLPSEGFGAWAYGVVLVSAEFLFIAYKGGLLDDIIRRIAVLPIFT